MQKHAKSFYWASLFFPSSLLPRVKALYALCRWLDDAVDESAHHEIALQGLDRIAEDLHSPSSQLAVNQLYKKNNLDVGYIDDLIEGARYDIHPVRIQTVEELIQYSYKVAGTVGLAMFDLIQAHPRQARAHAVDLGIAMQITNICRDVKEDMQKNRIYIPLQLLNKYQISEQDFMGQYYRTEQLAAVIRELLALADRYYLSAASAFHSIPLRSRGAVIIASQLYRGIGSKLLRSGANPMRGRTQLSSLEKLPLVGAGLVLWLWSGWARWSPMMKHDPQLHAALGTWRQRRGFQP